MKAEQDCPTDRFNLDDSELIYLAKIVGCQDPFVKMVLTCNRVEQEQQIHVCVHMKGQLLRIDVDKAAYALLKTPEQQTWNADVTLASVARHLEKELVIVEKEPNTFALDWLESHK